MGVFFLSFDLRNQLSPNIFCHTSFRWEPLRSGKGRSFDTALGLDEVFAETIVIMVLFALWFWWWCNLNSGLHLFVSGSVSTIECYLWMWLEQLGSFCGPISVVFCNELLVLWERPLSWEHLVMVLQCCGNRNLFGNRNLAIETCFRPGKTFWAWEKSHEELLFFFFCHRA